MTVHSLKLTARGRFYIDPRCDAQHIGPKSLVIEGEIYHRFMDFIYIPRPPSKLSFDEVHELCELRLEFAEAIIDRGLHRAVVNCMVERVKSVNSQLATDDALTVLDFGCGAGLASEEFRAAWGTACHITGLDVSRKAVGAARSHGVEAVESTIAGAFPFPTSSFDVVIAVFVFHFHIHESRFQEILRVLRPNGVLMFNLYGDVPESLWRNLETAGFDIIDGQAECTLPGSHQIYMAAPRCRS